MRDIETKEESNPADSVDPLVSPYDRIILSRKDDGIWSVISNPRWDLFTTAMNRLLFNEYNEYAEIKNTGATTRMIRVSDAEKYGIKIGELQIGWILRRDDGERA